MRKIRVRDAQGVRWSVRARRLRRGEASRPLLGPEEESLRRRLAGLLTPQPVVVPDPLRGVPGGWRTPGDTADIAMREAWAEFGDPRDFGSAGWVLTQVPRLVGDVLRHLRTPWSDTWQLEAAATGRIRRWARWEVDGLAATGEAAATVAAALEAGHVPQPSGAVLVDVVDQRPPVFRRRAAGLGRADRVG